MRVLVHLHLCVRMRVRRALAVPVRPRPRLSQKTQQLTETAEHQAATTTCPNTGSHPPRCHPPPLAPPPSAPLDLLAACHCRHLLAYVDSNRSNLLGVLLGALVLCADHICTSLDLAVERAPPDFVRDGALLELLWERSPNLGFGMREAVPVRANPSTEDEEDEDDGDPRPTSSTATSCAIAARGG